MRYLGIDYGRRRIGLAFSDVGARIAFQHGVLQGGGNKFAADQIVAMIKRERVDAIVIGLPLGPDGSETEESERVRKFAAEIGTKTNLQIEFENEMLSSKIAEGAGVAKEHLDEASAVLILQSFLDKWGGKFK